MGTLPVGDGVPVTFREVLVAIGPALSAPAATKADLIRAAHATGARRAVIDTLDRLDPSTTVRSVSELWAALDYLSLEL